MLWFSFRFLVCFLGLAGWDRAASDYCLRVFHRRGLLRKLFLFPTKLPLTKVFRINTQLFANTYKRKNLVVSVVQEPTLSFAQLCDSLLIPRRHMLLKGRDRIVENG
jgi:hypothetical protein